MAEKLTNEDLWPAVFGAGAETFPWWDELTFISGDWDTPGEVRVGIWDPAQDEGAATVTKTLTADDIRRAYNKAFHGGLRDACTGTPVRDLGDDLDACVADLILQIAVLGKETYA